jgi:hypothetical protein
MRGHFRHVVATANGPCVSTNECTETMNGVCADGNHGEDGFTSSGCGMRLARRC